VRVALDATPMRNGVTGIARYTATLHDGLLARGIDVRAFGIGRGPGALPPGARRLPIPLRVVHGAWRARVPLRAEAITGPVDLVHSIDLAIPPSRRPIVATIHDVAAIEFPELHPARATLLARRRLDGLDRAAAIIAVSGATADGLARLGVERSRVSVVYHAPFPLPAPPAGGPPVAGTYLLAVGELARRKDYPTLIRAFAAADVGAHRLVIVGPDGFGAEEVWAEAAAAGLGDRLAMLGRVSDADLAALYESATALCMSSREEGFGLPLVEAMSRGLPIIASDIAVVHEIAADAAITAPAGDPAGFAALIEQVVRDDGLRARLAAAGLARHRSFTWDAAVDGTIAAYRAALGDLSVSQG
jgi:glycosyltransferase involved in cell wall biosynthesis